MRRKSAQSCWLEASLQVDLLDEIISSIIVCLLTYEGRRADELGGDDNHVVKVLALQLRYSRSGKSQRMNQFLHHLLLDDAGIAPQSLYIFARHNVSI